MALTKEQKELKALAKAEKEEALRLKEIEDFELIARAQEKKNELKIEKIMYIVDDMDFGNIIIPEYQRDSKWTKTMKSKLIESILLGYFVPGIILAYNDDDTLDIVDGRTRMLSIKSFLDGEFALSKMARLTSLNGKKFSELRSDLKQIIRNFEIQVAIVKPESVEEIRDLFVRLNSNSVKLKPQEISNAKYMSNVVRLTKELAEDDFVKKVIPLKKSITRQQFISRLLSFMYYGEMRGKNVQDSIAIFYEDSKNCSVFELDEMRQNFIELLNIINDMDCSDLYSNINSQKSFVRTYFEEYAFASIFALVMKLDDTVLTNIDTIRNTIISIRENEKSIFEVSYNSHTTDKNCFESATSELITKCEAALIKVA